MDNCSKPDVPVTPSDPTTPKSIVTDTINSEPKGTDTVILEPKGTDTINSEPKGTDTVISEPKGMDTVILEPKGTDTIISEPKGTDTITPKTEGTDTITPEPKVTDNTPGPTTNPPKDEGTNHLAWTLPLIAVLLIGMFVGGFYIYRYTKKSGNLTKNYLVAFIVNSLIK